MLSKDLELTLNSAFKSAREKRHEFMTVEHLLLALLENDTALKVLNACGADVNLLRTELREFVDSTTPLFLRMTLIVKLSPLWAFSGCFSARFSMCSHPARKKLPVRMCWLRYSASRKARRSTC